MNGPRRTPGGVRRALTLVFGVLTVVVGITAMAAATTTAPDDALVRRGQDVYGQRCALCHGEQGLGQGAVPGIADAGPASIDFYLSTGRMPLEEIDQPIRHRAQVVTDQEKAALLAWFANLSGGAGPAIPTIDGYANANLARGLELFTSNCAACHGPTAAGVAVGQRDVSSNLDQASPLEIAEAIRIGPGVMPVFGEDVVGQDDLEAIVRWVLDLRERAAPGGAHLGRSGPVSEGFVAWFAGLGLLTIVMYLLGEHTQEGDDV